MVMPTKLLNKSYVGLSCVEFKLAEVEDKFMCLQHKFVTSTRFLAVY